VDELVDTVEAALAGGLVERLLHGHAGVAVGEVDFEQFAALGRHRDAVLLRGPAQDDLTLVVGEIAVWHVGAHAEFPDHLGHDGEAHHLPRCDRTVGNGARGVGDEQEVVDLAHDPKATAGRAGPVGVEGQRLGARRGERDAAHRAGEIEAGGDVDRGLLPVPVGAEVFGQSGEQQTQDVEQFGRGAEGTARTRNVGPLTQGQCGRDVPDAVDGGLGGVRHPAPGVGRQRLDVAAGALGVEDPHRQRRLAGAGNPCNGHHLVQWHVDVEVREVVHARAPHLDRGRYTRLVAIDAALVGHGAPLSHRTSEA
jgi:hypothetical protein